MATFSRRQQVHPKKQKTMPGLRIENGAKVDQYKCLLHVDVYTYKNKITIPKIIAEER